MAGTRPRMVPCVLEHRHWFQGRKPVVFVTHPPVLPFRELLASAFREATKIFARLGGFIREHAGGRPA